MASTSIVEALGVSLGPLRSITINLPPKSLLLVTGPPGSGKTLLLEILSGSQPPERGTVKICGLSPVEARRRGLTAYVPASTGWLASVRLRDIPGLVGGDPGEAASIIDSLGLCGYADKRAGEAPRSIALLYLYAAALTAHPRLLLLDTLLENIPCGASATVLSSMKRFMRNGSIVAAVNHPQLYMEAATHILRIRRGVGVSMELYRYAAAAGAPIVIRIAARSIDAVLDAVGGAVAGYMRRRHGLDLLVEPRSLPRIRRALAELRRRGLVRSYGLRGVWLAGEA